MDPSSMTIPAKNVPRRDMPRSSVIREESEQASGHPHVRFQEEPVVSQEPTAAGSAKPTFGAVDFGSAAPLAEKEDVLSPTEQ